MTELKTKPAFNPFVQKQMLIDARDTLDHINTNLDKWDLSRYRLTGESVPFVVDAVRNFIDGVYDLTDQKSFIFEFGPTDAHSKESRTVDAHLCIRDFICTNLKDQFMQCAPRNVFRPETLILEPAVKLLALQLLDRTIQRQQNVLQGRNEAYQGLFRDHQSDFAFPLGVSFVKAVGQLFDRVDKRVTDNGLRADILGALARDFYMGTLPFRPSENERSVADGIATQLRTEMDTIERVAMSVNHRTPANDISA